MNAKIWGIIGGVALTLALLSPLILGNAKKVEQLFEAAEAAYERSDYEDAIRIYKAALKESNKLAVKTEHIDKEFTTLANLKIAQCYYEHGEKTSDVRHYQSALTHIKEVVLDTQIDKHKEELTYLWAENLYKINELDQAKSKFSYLIETFPNSRWVPKALYTIGEINLKQENRDEALNTFQKLVNGFPHSEFKTKTEQRIAELINDVKPIPNPDPMDKAMYITAYDLKWEGKVYDAYQLYTDLITQYPDSEYVTDAYAGRAEIHLEAKDYINARANYEEAIYSTADAERKKEFYEAYHRTYLVPVYAERKTQTEPTDKLFVDARLLRKEERFLDAAKIYERLANSTLSTEDTAYALYWTGRCYCEAALTEQTLFGKSVDAFIKFITDYEGSSDTIKVYYHLALTYTEWAKVPGNQSKWQSVIDTVEKANTKYAIINDNTVQGWLSRMRELRDEASEKLPQPLKEEAERAINAAVIAIDRAKQEEIKLELIHEANEYLKRAKEEMYRDNYSAALEQAKKIPEILSRTPIPPLKQRYVNEGYIHLGQGKLKKATDKARQALSLDRNFTPADKLLSEIKEKHYGRGWTFFDEGNYTKAISEFRSAINIDPNFKEAHCHLGVIYIEKEQYTEAIKPLKKAIEIDKEFKEAHFNLALAHLELGEFEDARNAANAALRIDPNYKPARMLIEFIAN